MNDFSGRFVVAERLCAGESVTQVFADMRKSFLTDRISGDRFIDDCDLVFQCFHHPKEITLKGDDACHRLAKDCLDELATYKDLFEGADIKNVVFRHEIGRVENFTNCMAAFAIELIDKHFHYWNDEAKQQNAIKFTLGVLLTYPEILYATFDKIDRFSHKDDFKEFKAVFRKAVLQLKDELGLLHPQLTEERRPLLNGNFLKLGFGP